MARGSPSPYAHMWSPNGGERVPSRTTRPSWSCGSAKANAVSNAPLSGVNVASKTNETTSGRDRRHAGGRPEWCRS